MAEIRIEAKPVIGFADLLYLVFVNDVGAEFVIRGGPHLDYPPFGAIVTENGIPLNLDSEDYRPIEDRGLHGSRVLDLGGRDANAVWVSMVQAVSLIGASNTDYDAFQNSNSVVASVLHAVGIDVNGVLPNLEGIDSYPGVSNALLDDYERIFLSEHTSSEMDILRGGHLDDTFILGGGNDDLETGIGNDILVGDQGADLLNGGENLDAAVYSGSIAGSDTSGVHGIRATVGTGEDFDLVGSVVDNWGATDTLYSIEIIIGPSGLKL